MTCVSREEAEAQKKKRERRRHTETENLGIVGGERQAEGERN